MKKMISLLICILLLVATAVTAYADSPVNMYIQAQSSTVQPGDTVSFTVSVDTVENCRSGGIVLSYDTNVFEFVGGECLVSGAVMSDFSGGTGVFAFSDGQTLSGSIFRFSLRFKASAPYGSYSVYGSANIRTVEGSISSYVCGATLSYSCSHTYGNWANQDSSTHQRSCSQCGSTETAVHSWDGGKMTKQPTCKEDGRMTYTCTDCGAEKSEAIAKTDSHTFGAWVNADGSTHRQSCTVCGLENTANHNWNNGKVTKQPSCKEDGRMTYTCTDCGAEKSESIAKTDNHAYDHACDAACNICGATREISHSYGSKWVSNRDGHYRVCTVCGVQRESKAHTPGKEATESSDQTCTVCGYVIQAALGHKHSYADTLSWDETGHWYACGGCGTKDVSAHRFDNACDPNCDACGYTREISHSTAPDWSADAESHWHTCTVCGEVLDTDVHVPGPEATEDAAQVCTVCGYEISPKLEPTASEEVTESQPVPETTEAVEMTESAEREEPTENTTAQFPWWPVAIALGLLVIGAVMLMFLRK